MGHKVKSLGNTEKKRTRENVAFKGTTKQIGKIFKQGLSAICHNKPALLCQPNIKFYPERLSLSRNCVFLNSFANEGKKEMGQ